MAVKISVDNSGQNGAQLQGRVYLQVDEDKVSALSVVLRLVGLEKVCVSFADDTGSGSNSHVYASSEIARIQATLAEFPAGEVSKGRYEFPFVLVIPSYVPGSQKGPVSADYFAIEYVLEAELIRPASIMNSKVVHSTGVSIKSPPVVGPPEPSRVPPHIVPVMFCCCLGTGQMKLTAIVDNTRLATGEGCNVSFGIQDMSSLTVAGVEVSLMQVVRGRVEGHSFCHPTQLFKQHIPGIDVPGAQTKKNGQVYQSALEQMNTDLLMKLHISVPTCRPTYNGKIGSVTHMLIVKAITMICTVNPSIEIPMKISDGTRSAPDNTQGPYFGVSAQVSPALSGVSVHSVQYLIQLLQSNNESLEVSIVGDWLAQGGEVDELTPDMLQTVFGCLRQELSFSRLTEDIGAALRGRLTVYHVAGAARGAPESQRSNVCIGFAKYVQDKSAARSVLSDTGLSQSALDMVVQGFYN